MNGENTSGSPMGDMQSPSRVGVAKKDEGQIPHQIGLLDKAVGGLGETIEYLEGKINPILGDNTPREESIKDETACSVTVAEAIRVQKSRVKSLNIVLRNLIDRIEL